MGKKLKVNPTTGNLDIVNYESLSEVLVNGNSTNGSVIVITEDDNITFEQSGYSSTLTPNILNANINHTLPKISGVLGLASIVSQIDNTDSPYTASWSQDLEVDCSGGAVTINLPTAVGNNGETITITKVDSSVNAITIDANSTQTINGALTQSIGSQWTSLLLKSNGTNVTIR